MRTVIAALVLVASFAVLAQEKPKAASESAVATAPGKGAAARLTTITASLEAVDAANRTVTLKDRAATCTRCQPAPRSRTSTRSRLAIASRSATTRRCAGPSARSSSRCATRSRSSA